MKQKIRKSLLDNLYPKLIAKGATHREAIEMVTGANQQSGMVLTVPFAGGFVVCNREGVGLINKQ